MAVNHDATPAGYLPGGHPTLPAGGSVPPFPEPAVGYFGIDVPGVVTVAFFHIILAEDIALLPCREGSL